MAQVKQYRDVTRNSVSEGGPPLREESAHLASQCTPVHQMRGRDAQPPSVAMAAARVWRAKWSVARSFAVRALFEALCRRDGSVCVESLTSAWGCERHKAIGWLSRNAHCGHISRVSRDRYCGAQP